MCSTNCNDDDFKSYGTKVLEEFKKRATEAGYQMPQSYEGIRLTFKGEDVQGWILLRMSLHDPVMPMNIEGARKGDLAKLKEIAKELTDGFDKLFRRYDFVDEETEKSVVVILQKLFYGKKQISDQEVVVVEKFVLSFVKKFMELQSPAKRFLYKYLYFLV